MGAAGCKLRGPPASQNTSILTRVWLDVIDNYYRLMRMGTLKTTCGDQRSCTNPSEDRAFSVFRAAVADRIFEGPWAVTVLVLLTRISPFCLNRLLP